jgi:ATP-dependent DNA helicase PIF1
MKMPDAIPPPPYQEFPTSTHRALNERQQQVMDAVRRGQSVFYTGCAGTGKSYLLGTLVALLPKKTTWVTAMTGIAALNIGGRTLHSQAGIGMARKSASDLARFMKSQKRVAWRQCTTLIIDEVSMLSRELFEKLDEVARIIRCDSRPFGGIKLVLSGDFFQLPPVSQETEGPSTEFCFQSPLWNTAVPVQLELTHVFRQTDTAFVALLKEVRMGKLSAGTVDTLSSLDRALPDRSGVIATRLFPMNSQVDLINEQSLHGIPGEVFLYEAEDYVKDEENRALMEKNCLAPTCLYLKEGAQVMLLKNLGDNTHVNGSRGVVVGFHPDSKMPRVRFLSGATLELEPAVWEYETRDGDLLATRTQIPLRLAWAVTVHKSQGLTIDMLEVDLEGTFADGQAYVALSRARSMEGLRVLNFHPSHVRTHPLVSTFVLSSS